MICGHRALGGPCICIFYASARKHEIFKADLFIDWGQLKRNLKRLGVSSRHDTFHQCWKYSFIILLIGFNKYLFVSSSFRYAAALLLQICWNGGMQYFLLTAAAVDHQIISITTSLQFFYVFLTPLLWFLLSVLFQIYKQHFIA